ncbi:hypothetical protein EC973_006709 [Apophysomyces ossiformis]|uniref:Uncharacterized protein n=1 Tax=Apophysomyces ossiformis TaxID=679940 RepID=A0A8H7EQB3_9FUNG|nr:hypothetical protein EC973_006709 [Apophysomyces ossiformis]
MVRIYHAINWFFVLLILTTTVAYWIYFKVKQNTYVNDCQDLVNGGSMPNNSTYTPVAVPGKHPVAGGSDKSYCIDMINKLVIGSAIVVFVGNFIQVYFASSIGIYSTSLKRQYKQLKEKNEEDCFEARN